MLAPYFAVDFAEKALEDLSVNPKVSKMLLSSAEDAGVDCAIFHVQQPARFGKIAITPANHSHGI